MIAKSRKGLINRFQELSAPVAAHFEHLPRLVFDFPLSVSLAYTFLQLGLAQNRSLYQGTVKLHKVDAQITRFAIGSQHMTRKGFESLFLSVFSYPVPQDLAECLKKAEDVRDQVMHGKNVSEAQIRDAVWNALQYTDGLYAFLQEKNNLRICGNSKGFSGRAKKHDRKTSRLILKGLGFSLQ